MPGHRQVLLRELADVIHEAVERVLPRIDRPDDFVDRLRQLARGVGDLDEVGLHFVGRLPSRELAQQRDLRQPRAQIVVNVASDPAAVPLDGPLPFEPLEPPAQPPRRDVSHRPGHERDGAETHGGAKPPGLRKVRQHGEGLARGRARSIARLRGWPRR